MKHILFRYHFFLCTLFLTLFITTISCALDGGLDSTFDGDGKVTTSAGVSSEILGIAQQADGKIVAVGRSDGDVALARYNLDGSLDVIFGTGGIVTTDLGGTDDRGWAVAIQDDQKIVVVGQDSNSGSRNFVIIRYQVNGNLDPTFGITSTGVTSTNVSGNANDNYAQGITIQSDGNIVATGRAEPGSFTDFATVRYTSAGALDLTFNGTGIVITDVSGTDSPDVAHDVVIQSDGKILVAGDSGSGIALVRYEIDGSFDSGFGTSGIVTAVGGNANSLALQANKSIVVGGDTGSGDMQSRRFTTGGVLDTSFGISGSRTIDFGSGTFASGGYIAVTANDKIVVVGGVNLGSGITDFAVARLTKNGDLDDSFGGFGLITTDFSGSNDGAFAVLIQQDQKIVVAGGADSGEPGREFALARYDVQTCIGNLLIGSDIVSEIFTTQQLVGQNGRIASLAILKEGFGLCGDGIFDSWFPVIGNVCLAGHTLTLQADLMLDNNSDIGSLGFIMGNNHVIDLTETVACLPTFMCTSTILQ